jgi:hypothetical protein
VTAEPVTSTRRVALLGGAAVLLLGAASLAFVLWPGRTEVPGEGAPSSGSDPGAAPAPAPAPAAVPAGAVAAPQPVAVEPEPPVPPPRIRGRPRAASSVAWEDVPTAARMADLGPELAAPVNAALRAARDTMESCFEEDTRLQASRAAPRYGPDDQPHGPAVLVLRMESRAGGLDVVDTEVESQGTSTRELVACARHVLKGWPIPAPAARPGTRFRLTYLLQ